MFRICFHTFAKPFRKITNKTLYLFADLLHVPLLLSHLTRAGVWHTHQWEAMQSGMRRARTEFLFSFKLSTSGKLLSKSRSASLDMTGGGAVSWTWVGHGETQYNLRIQSSWSHLSPPQCWHYNSRFFLLYKRDLQVVVMKYWDSLVVLKHYHESKSHWRLLQI